MILITSRMGIPLVHYWKLLEIPGINVFSSGKAPWNVRKFDKSPEIFLEIA